MFTCYNSHELGYYSPPAVLGIRTTPDLLQAQCADLQTTHKDLNPTAIDSNNLYLL